MSSGCLTGPALLAGVDLQMNQVESSLFGSRPRSIFVAGVDLQMYQAESLLSDCRRGSNLAAGSDLKMYQAEQFLCRCQTGTAFVAVVDLQIHQAEALLSGYLTNLTSKWILGGSEGCWSGPFYGIRSVMTARLCSVLLVCWAPSG